MIVGGEVVGLVGNIVQHVIHVRQPKRFRGGRSRGQGHEIQPRDLAVTAAADDQRRRHDLFQGIDRVLDKGRSDAGLHRRRYRKPRWRRIDDLPGHDGVDGLCDRREHVR